MAETSTEDLAQRVSALLALARQQEDAGDREAASRSLETALQIDPASWPALARLAGLLSRHGRRGAFIHLLDLAREHHRRRLAVDPLDGRSLRMLREVQRLAGARDGVQVIAALLQAVEGEDPRRNDLVTPRAPMRPAGKERGCTPTAAGLEAQRGRRGPLDSAGGDAAATEGKGYFGAGPMPLPIAQPRFSSLGAALLGDEVEELLLHPALSRPLVAILRRLAPWYPRLAPGEGKRFGRRKAERITTASFSPLATVLPPLLELLGLGSLEVFLGKEGASGILPIVDPPGLLVGAELLQQAAESELRFHLAGALLCHRLGFALPLRLDGEERAALLSAIVELSLAGQRQQWRTSGAPSALQRRLARAIPAEVLHDLAPHAMVLQRQGLAAATGELPGLACYQGDRMGLLAAGDPGAAMTGILRRTLGREAAALGGAARRQLLAAQPAAGELIRFAASPEHLELRRRLYAPPAGPQG